MQPTRLTLSCARVCTSCAQILDLSHNRITRVCGLSELPYLEALLLSDNQLTSREDVEHLASCTWVVVRCVLCAACTGSVLACAWVGRRAVEPRCNPARAYASAVRSWSWT